MSHFREPVNGFTHLAGAVLAAGGLIWLIGVTHNHPSELLPILIYGLCTIALYVASATFHLSSASENTLLWLRRLDHAAIYMMIAGTYTPILYYSLQGGWRWGMLAVVWGMALLGMAYKLLFLSEASRLSLFYYIAMGSVGLVALPQALAALPPTVILLIALGGLCYLCGAIIFGIQKPNFYPQFGHHEIWHLLVLTGSAFHFAAIMRCFA